MRKAAIVVASLRAHRVMLHCQHRKAQDNQRPGPSTHGVINTITSVLRSKEMYPWGIGSLHWPGVMGFFYRTTLFTQKRLESSQAGYTTDRQEMVSDKKLGPQNSAHKTCVQI